MPTLSPSNLDDLTLSHHTPHRTRSGAKRALVRQHRLNRVLPRQEMPIHRPPSPPRSHHPTRLELHRTRRTSPTRRRPAQQAGARLATERSRRTCASEWGPPSTAGSCESANENSQPSQEQLASNGARQGPISNLPPPPLLVRTEKEQKPSAAALQRMAG